MTTRLVAVAAYLPPNSVTLESVADELGLTPVDVRVYQKFYGLVDIRVDTGADVADLLISAAKGIGTLAWAAHRVRYVVHARTVQPTGAHSINPLLTVARTLGIERAVSFAVTQHACASGLLAVDLAGRLLAGESDPDALALVLTGEKTYPHVNRLMPVPTIMGEASAACLVGRGEHGDEMLSYVWRAVGEYCAGPELPDAVRQKFQREYPQTLAELMREAADRAGLGLDDVKMVLPHNVNRMSWIRVAQLIDFPVDRIYLDNVPVTGHCFCADPFVNYASALQDDRLGPGDPYMMVSVGLGAIFSAMVFRHRGVTR